MGDDAGAPSGGDSSGASPSPTPQSGTTHSFASMLNENIRAYAPKRHKKKSFWEAMSGHRDEQSSLHQDKAIGDWLKK